MVSNVISAKALQEVCLAHCAFPRPPSLSLFSSTVSAVLSVSVSSRNSSKFLIFLARSVCGLLCVVENDGNALATFFPPRLSPTVASKTGDFGADTGSG